MKTKTLVSAFLIGAVFTGLNTGSAVADASSIVVTTPWLRATPNGAPVAGGYATITNNGTQPDRLVGASLPIAANGEIHTMSMKAGIMHMERLEHGLEINPGTTVTLSPGGYHVMFMKPNAQLKEGEAIKGTLTFEKAGQIPVTFAVGGMAAKSAPNGPSDGKGMKRMDRM